LTHYFTIAIIIHPCHHSQQQTGQHVMKVLAIVHCWLYSAQFTISVLWLSVL